MLGGHSGLNIHEDRANAVRLAARAATAVLAAAGPDARLSEIGGGDKRNAIAREAMAVLIVPAGRAADAAKEAARQLANFRAEFGTLEADLDMKLTPLAGGSVKPARALDPSAATRLLQLIVALPHGALKKSHELQSEPCSLCPPRGTNSNTI